MLEPVKVELGKAIPITGTLNLVSKSSEPQKVTDVMVPDLPGSSPSIAPPPGLAAPSSVPSVGSALHGTGTCRPCAWLWKPQGCQNGAECRHCHLCPEGEIKARRKVKVDTFRHSDEDESASPQSSPAQLCLAEALGDVQASPAMVELDPFMLERSAFESGKQLKLPLKSKSGLGGINSPAFIPGATQSATVGAQHVIPSPGSALHGSGMCRPCAWFWKSKGCENGEECRHCHLCLEDEIKNRRKMKVAVIKTISDGKLDQDPLMLWPMGFPPSASPTPLQDPASLVFGLGGELRMEALGTTPTMVGDILFGASEDDFGAKTPVPIALAASLPLPSVGSSLHAAGKCRPCAWFWKPQGCQNAQECAHCHLCPEDELKSRKKVKENAMRIGALTPKRNGDAGASPRTVRIAPLILGA